MGLGWGLGGGGRWGGGGGGGQWLKTAEILLAESCCEQVSFEFGFKQRKGGRISEIGWQRVPDRCQDGARKLKERSPNVLVLCSGTFRSFSHDELRFCLGSYAHRV